MCKTQQNNRTSGNGHDLWKSFQNFLRVLDHNLLAEFSQNSKSKENWIWRAPVPAIGCLNPGIGFRFEPKTGLIWETFALLNRLNTSATTSRRFPPPNGKYFRTRKSNVASGGVFREFLPKANGLAD